MAGEKMIDRVVRIVKNPKFIRNVCTSAHIHHGKTALTDNLLAAAGMMASKYAGSLEEGMMTWQHKDEQERLLTVDAANVSMVHEYKGGEYLINLIDTPGHVDFGGNVTRAMRAIDGTIVMVCAVEGVMPQTETVIKQALRERVKPVLFINKCDRLIKELKLSPEKIQERLAAIIKQFNQLLEDIAEPEFKEKWKVNIVNGTVAFGSARDNWALSLPFMKKKNVKFSDIQRIYEMTEEERKPWVWENAPLFEVLLDMVITHLPDPAEAQPYRIPKLWNGDIESEFGKDLMTCNPDGKLGFCITRIVIDPRSGKEISAGRLFSGTMHQGEEVWLNRAKQRQRVQLVLIYNGIKPEAVESLPAGNVFAISGLVGQSGETITSEPEQPFEEIRHIFEPVITKAIEANKASDLPKLVEVLRKVSKEDPSIRITINEDTGEHLISGMGELHLEIVENRIKTEKNVDVKTSDPIVIYHETVGAVSPEVEGKSPNKHNKFYFIVEPLEDAIYQSIKAGRIHEGRIKKKDEALWKALEEGGMPSKTTRNVIEVFNGNLFIDETRGIVALPEVIELILDGFEDVMNAGPLAREPCTKLKIRLIDCKLHEDAIHRGPSQVYPAIRDALRTAMLNARAAIFEPLQILQLEAPIEYMGELSKLVQNRRGQLLDMVQQGSATIVKAKIPVSETFGLSNDLRSATNGRGNQSLVDQVFEKLPSELQARVIKQIRERKGLKSEE